MDKFESDEINKDMKITTPASLLKVSYNGVDISPGQVMTPTQVQDQPVLSWEVEEGAFYTVIMNDPDAKSRAEPMFREWHHWMVGNIPGNNVSAGETLSAYVGSGPPEGTGLHRYVFLVYKQPSKLPFDGVPRLGLTPDQRPNHKAAEFAAKHGLQLIAGNYYQAEYDDYVPK